MRDKYTDNPSRKDGVCSFPLFFAAMTTTVCYHVKMVLSIPGFLLGDIALCIWEELVKPFHGDVTDVFYDPKIVYWRYHRNMEYVLAPTTAPLLSLP
jgi:hypothetical protein